MIKTWKVKNVPPDIYKKLLYLATPTGSLKTELGWKRNEDKGRVWVYLIGRTPVSQLYWNECKGRSEFMMFTKKMYRRKGYMTKLLRRFYRDHNSIMVIMPYSNSKEALYKLAKRFKKVRVE